MELSITTDYQSDTGCPEESLRAIAAAGFTHVHWCHQWNTDFLYCESELGQIEKWLREFGLKLLDLHGSAGREKCWFSVREYERLAGVELVKNRIEMTARLGGSAVVMHAPMLPAGADSGPECDQVRRSMDELVPDLRRSGIRIALENMGDDDFRFIRSMLAAHGPEVLGICYDSGHGNLRSRRGLDHLEQLKDRLIALHLHDNDGTGDQHRIPFTGTVYWNRLAGIIASSAYRGCISMESTVKHTPEGERGTFLRDAYAAGARLTTMLKR